MPSRKVLLMILDGWGISPDPRVSAIDQAKKPFFDGLWQKYIHATLNTTGLAVGLPEGQMGNSEVGHMNIGAGRVVYQELVRINEAFKNGDVNSNPALQETVKYLKENPDARLHLMGLVSDGGVHSHINHLLGLLAFFHAQGIAHPAVHAFTDGRDCDPKSGLGFLKTTLDACKASGAELASICGRYYAMDRDKRWERVKLAYDLLVNGVGESAQDPLKAVQHSYDNSVTDEFIKPIVVTGVDDKPLATLKDGDAVLLFNFRTDRGRQITQVLSQQDMPEQGMHTVRLHYTTMTRYDDTYKDVGVVFEKDNLEDTLGETLAKAGKRQIRIAETEKYPHVTFFFNGGREEPFNGEERILCPSPKVATYDLKPEMSAFEIKDKIIPRLESEEPDFICLNFANTDMVGHTGVFDAARRACEAVDQCLTAIVPVALQHGYTCWLIADHGNSDNMINPDGSPNTQHSTNPVPSILVGPEFEQGKGYTLKDGRLGEVAPTILDLLGVAKPDKMGESLLAKG